MAQDTLIPLGQIVNTHATRGEMRMRLFNPDSTTIGVGSQVVLRRGSQHEHRRVTAVRPHKQFLLLTLEGCASMTAAQALIGCEVCVPERDLPSTGADAIYHYQLVGMTVVTTAGTQIGTIAEVLATPSNDVCVVRDGTREHLIPFIADVVKELDRERGCMVIDPIPGLLDG